MAGSDQPLPENHAAPPPARKQSGSGRAGGSTVISVFSLSLLLVALVFAYVMKNDNLLVLLAGVIATNATTVVSFWVGSSASSQNKDETISGQLLSPNAAQQK